MKLDVVTINFVNEPIKEGLDENIFSELTIFCMELFPIIEHITNPIIHLKSDKHSKMTINPLFLELEFGNASITSPNYIELANKIARYYYDLLKVTTLQQLNCKFTSVFPAAKEEDYKEGEVRKLFKDVKLFIPKSITRKIASKDALFGVRLIFEEDNVRYDLRVEPYLRGVKNNFVELRAVTKNVNLDQVSNFIKTQENFFLKDILNLLEADHG